MKSRFLQLSIILILICFIKGCSNSTNSEDGFKSGKTNFMLTPRGLAMIYEHGEISGMAQGVVILYVEYSDVVDILNLHFDTKSAPDR